MLLPRMSEALLLHGVLHHLREMVLVYTIQIFSQSAPISADQRAENKRHGSYTEALYLQRTGVCIVAQEPGDLKSVTFPEEPSIASSARPITSESLISSA